MSAGPKILSSIREKMKAKGFGALYVPSSDPHMSEYVAPKFARRPFVSNFSGSAGTAVIPCEGNALLWTDGRYWLEAGDTLYPGWQLMKDGLPETQKIPDVLKGSDKSSIPVVGADPFTLTIDGWETLAKEGVKLVAMNENLVDQVWQELGGKVEGIAPQVALSKDPVFDHPVEFAGQPASEKIDAVKKQLVDEKCDLMVLSALDEIAWLFNLRGSDVDCNPVFYSYVVVSNEAVVLFLDPAKVPEKIKNILTALGVTLQEYSETALEAYLTEFAGQKQRSGSNALCCAVDPRQISHGIKLILEKNGIETKSTTSCAKNLKAKKNDIQLQGIRDCHIRDGAALTRFLAWVEKEVQSGTVLSEVQAADKLEAFRREDDRFVQLSFPTITSSGPSGAVIHYRANSETCRNLSKDEIYLCDSGAQYIDGTTDVTRVLAFSPPTEFQKDAYTGVLKGHIAIDTATFPVGTVNGHRLDSFARKALWDLGLDYAHGTGHGVGHFMNVHEGPVEIYLAMRAPAKFVPLENRMVVSNEPGYYKDGEFGMRIENLVIVVEKDTKYGNGKKSLGFERVTFAPLCPELINKGALTQKEIDWVNTYHAEVRKKLEPVLEAKKDELALSFLRRTTAEI